MPLAVSATTRSGRIDAESTNDSTWSANGSSRSALVSATRRVAAGARAVPVEHVLGDRLDLGEPGVDADRAGAREAELDAVVLSRVVRGGEHRARGVERAGGEVHQVGRGQPEVDDVDALLEHAVGERVDQLRAGRAHVAADEHPIGASTEAGEADTERVRDLGVELIGHRAPDVVGLDDLVEY